MTNRVCPVDGREVIPSRFGRRKYCATKCQQKANRQRNREKIRARNAADRLVNGDRTRNSHYQRRYGITLADYERLLAAQGGRCLICRKMPRKMRLGVDHDHKTGRIRGLLCAGLRGCNRALGTFETQADLARRAGEYLLTIADDLDQNVSRERSK